MHFSTLLEVSQYVMLSCLDYLCLMVDLTLHVYRPNNVVNIK